MHTVWASAHGTEKPALAAASWTRISTVLTSLSNSQLTVRSIVATVSSPCVLGARAAPVEATKRHSMRGDPSPALLQSGAAAKMASEIKPRAVPLLVQGRFGGSKLVLNY